MPPLAPVTTAVRPAWSGMSAAVHRPRVFASMVATGSLQLHLIAYQNLMSIKIQPDATSSTGLARPDEAGAVRE
jgi:hypothetical protein